MKIEHEFTVSVPIEQAWVVLTDLEGIAPCLPGAQLTGSDGETFKGRVKIKVGPVTSEYAGSAAFLEKDDAAHRAVIDAKGKDSRGAGNASAVITAVLTAQGERTVVSVDTDLKISGKVAQLGSGMIKEVSEKLLEQFVDCLEAKLAAPHPPSPEMTGGAPTTASQPSIAKPSAAGLATASEVTDSGSEPALRPALPPEPAALDLMDLAGGPIYKRLLPVAAGVAVVVAAVIIYRLVR